jgi:hypothetical protein
MSDIESGGTQAGVALVMKEINQRAAEREALVARIASAVGPPTLSQADAAAILTELGGLAGALTDAMPDEHAAIYSVRNRPLRHK